MSLSPFLVWQETFTNIYNISGIAHALTKILPDDCITDNSARQTGQPCSATHSLLSVMQTENPKITCKHVNFLRTKFKLPKIHVERQIIDTATLHAVHMMALS